MKKFFNQTTVTVLLVIVLLVLSGLTALAFKKIHDLENTVANQNQGTSDIVSISMSALNAVSFSQPAVSVSDNRVYFPDLRLALPLGNDTLSFMYSGRSVGNPAKETSTVYDVTTRPLATLSPIGFQTRLACHPLRLAFEDKANPFNPYENNHAAVKLADGRTLQIYAFSDPACEQQWQAAGVNPDQLKNIFKQATSY